MQKTISNKLQEWVSWQLPYCPSGCEFKEPNAALQNPPRFFALCCSFVGGYKKKTGNRDGEES